MLSGSICLYQIVMWPKIVLLLAKSLMIQIESFGQIYTESKWISLSMKYLQLWLGFVRYFGNIKIDTQQTFCHTFGFVLDILANQYLANIRLFSIVTRWLDYLVNFGYLQRGKYADVAAELHWQKSFATKSCAIDSRTKIGAMANTN